MGFNVRDGGSFKPLQNAKARVGGAWVQIKAVAVRTSGGWQVVWQHLITATVAASVNNLDVSTLFAADVWAATTPKEVVVAEGVTVGSVSAANAAMDVPDTWGGVLTIRNFGNIDGAGGEANGGAGGAAISNAKSGLLVVNEFGGNIRGGGGGGGHGGAGGNGSFTEVVREPPTGVADVMKSYWVSATWYWNNAVVKTNNGAWSVTVGDYTYHAVAVGRTTSTWVNKGGGDGYYNTTSYWSIYRTSNPVTETDGGAGGNGGRGQGSNQAYAAGDNGAVAGGTNAGAGGVGGVGGGWGLAGAAGAAGVDGTITNGGAGAAGGAAGAAIAGAASTVTNNGTILGAY